MAIYYYCSRIMPNTKCWDDLQKILNIDLEGKRKSITYISGSMNEHLIPKKIKEESKSYRNGASKNLTKLGIEFANFNLIWKNDDYSKIVDQILCSDVIYLLGGNPLEQMNFIKVNGLQDVFKAYQGIVIGVSGGAMTMSSKIIVPAYGDVYPETKICDGLNLSEINVFPHFQLDRDNTIIVKDGKIDASTLIQVSKEHKILGLPNESILRCSKDGMHIIGDDPQIICDESIKNSSLIEDQIDSVKVKKLVYRK